MKKQYRVVGTAEVLGHAPGSTFEAEIPAEQEARLLERGSLATVSKSDPVKPKTKIKETN